MQPSSFSFSTLFHTSTSLFLQYPTTTITYTTKCFLHSPSTTRYNTDRFSFPEISSSVTVLQALHVGIVGMGKHSCCFKQKLKKGLWSPEEDEKLLNYITQYGHGCWSSVPKQAGLRRCGKSCRLRWINYLRPDLKRGTFSEEEENLIIELHQRVGNRWSQIAAQLPGRTDNEIKNFWNSTIKKKLRHRGIDPNTQKSLLFEDTTTTRALTDRNSTSTTSSAETNIFRTAEFQSPNFMGCSLPMNKVTSNIWFNQDEMRLHILSASSISTLPTPQLTGSKTMPNSPWGLQTDNSSFFDTTFEDIKWYNDPINCTIPSFPIDRTTQLPFGEGFTSYESSTTTLEHM